MTTDAYRHLCDLPPILGEGAARPLPAEPRRLAAWVESLPRANAQAVQRQFRDALDALAARKVGGAARLEALEALRKPVLEVVAQLERQFVGAAFPLAGTRVQAALDAESFHIALAYGYRQAAAELCAPAGKVPLLRGGQVALALGRALHHYGRALAEAWLAYRAPQPGSWQGLHCCHAFAVASRIAGKGIEDPFDGRHATLSSLYLAALLVSACNPYAYSQPGQEMLWLLAYAYAPHCRLSADGGDGAQGIVDPGSDSGPGIGGGDLDHTMRLDTGRLLADIERELSAGGEGATASLSPARGIVVPVTRKLLQDVRRGLGGAAGRAHARLSAGHHLDTVIGLSALHYHLAGRQDFDAFVRHAREGQIQMTDRAAWAHAAVDTARVPLSRVRVLDQSLHGYRLVWGADAQARVRVGELVGLSLAGESEDEERDWMVGIVRWLRYEDDGGVCAGVQLLARRAAAVGLCGPNGHGDSRPPLRAFAVGGVDGEPRARYLSADMGPFDGGEVEILRIRDPGDPDDDRPTAFRVPLGVLHNSGDYVLLGTLAPEPELSP